MKDIKKILNVFGNYLKEDSAVEIIRTSHGVTVGAWDDNNGGWEDFVSCPTAKALCIELCRQYCAFYELIACAEKGGDLTEEERQPILARCAVLCLACGFSPLEIETLQGFLPKDKPLTALSQPDAKVYVHLPTQELSRAFMEQAEAEDFSFYDGTKPTERPDETFVCLNPDHTLSFIGMFGRQAYGSGTNTTCGKTLVRVEFVERFQNVN